jgi:hypothetical protein
MVWLGWIITILPCAALVFSGVLKLMKPPEFLGEFGKLGWSEDALLGLAIVEIGGVVLCLFPRTALFGVVVLTGYLGGAAATHVRLGDAFVPPIIVGFLLWLGLLLRDHRVRSLLPWRSDASVTPAGGFFPAVGKTLLTLLLLVGVIVALAEALPRDYRVTRSTTVAAAPADVFPHVNDFEKWKPWNPFLDSDPDVKVTIEGSPGPGAVYSWTGKTEGKISIVSNEPNERIKLKLEMIRPIPGNSDVEFTFKPDGKNTIVTWTMVGERNLLTKTFGSVIGMDKMLGSEFEKGLSRIKTTAEAKK